MTAPLLASDLDEVFTLHRRELTGFCYRMLGAASEAEDAVQETLVRAWRHADRFEGRSTVRTWLYRIANNVCIDMLRSPQRRARPMDFGPAVPQQGAVVGPTRPLTDYVLPVIDQTVIDTDGDPAAVVEARETVRLAFVAALQHLPPRQRAALILCEVLKWQATEAAELLDTTVASINSALQRARATLASATSEPLSPRLDAAHEALLARYVDAFERYDIPALTALLREDAVMTMPPFDLWIQGRDDLSRWFAQQGAACEGSTLIPLDVNGTAGYASYKRDADGTLHPWAIQVIDVADGWIVGHHNFIGPELFAAFGLPAHLEPTQR
jgi:RNA polymerase sigma-70 factor, ECF subfamily